MRPNADLCPKGVQESFNRYVNDGCPPGDFCRACLENDLMEAFARADNYNLEALPHIVAWLYSEMPANIWGSREIVDAHLNSKLSEMQSTKGKT